MHDLAQTREETTRLNWTRDELILAFNLYCKIPFGKIHIRNPQVVALAKLLGRSPSAVSWKLANFARLDSALKKRNISGASHGAKADVEVWKEFHGNWDGLAFDGEELLRKMGGRDLLAAQSLPKGLTRESTVTVRVNQAFFRSAVLAAYDFACCISGLNVPALLNASHIVPWAVDARNRTNPRNGLCLSAIHDRAFDCGLITVTPDYYIKVSAGLKRKKQASISKFFLQYEGTRIVIPERFQPDPTFLRYHTETVFQP